EVRSSPRRQLRHLGRPVAEQLVLERGWKGAHRPPRLKPVMVSQAAAYSTTRRKLGRVAMGHIPHFRYTLQIPQKGEGPGGVPAPRVGLSTRQPLGGAAPVRRACVVERRAHVRG